MPNPDNAIFLCYRDDAKRKPSNPVCSILGARENGYLELKGLRLIEAAEPIFVAYH